MAARIPVGWRPFPGAQMAFISCPAFECLGEGNRGGGKTETALVDFLQHVDEGYGMAWRGLVFRRTFPELQDIVAKSRVLIPRLFPTARFITSPTPTWVFEQGERLMFRPLMRDSDYDTYHGHEYPFILFEELTRWPTDTLYRRMMSCCRSTIRGIPRKIRATTNPAGPGHNWVKLRFGLPAPVGRTVGRPIAETFEDGSVSHRVSVRFSLDENLALKNDTGYRQRIAMAARSEGERRAWLYGDWDIVSGGMFDDVWSEARRFAVVPQFSVPDSWRIDRAFDWGSSKPFSVGWYAESDGTDLMLPNGRVLSTVPGDLFRIAEWYGWTGAANEGSRMLARDIATGIVEREVRMGLFGRVRPGPADSAIFTRENGQCIADDMAMPVRVDGRQMPGVRWVPANKAPGSRINGWEQLRNRLSNTVPRSGAREAPGLFVTNACEQFLRTVPVLPRDENRPDDVDTESEDHIGDEVRYRVLAERRVARVGSRRGV